MDDLDRLLDTAFLKTLSEPVRIDILRQLMLGGRQDVSAIAQELPQDRSVISRHLSLMKNSGLIISEQEGRHTYYRLNGVGLLTRLQEMTDKLRAYMEDCCPEELEEKRLELR